jgi:ABC-2 type transport system permease protein
VTETLSAFRAERRKLQAQLATKLLALVCVVGPFAFAGVLSSQTASPADTLFGVWVHSSGFAISLVVLGFCGGWGFPLIAGIIAGDIFSSEDRYGTWKTVLTRSRTREHLFVGKVLAAVTFSLGLLALVAISSLVAGLVFVGDQNLIGLSGTVLASGHALLLVLLSWILSVPPMLAFTALAMLLSVATRNGIVGVIGPSVAGLIMQLLLLIGAGIWAHAVLVSSAFNDWHPLFVAHPFYELLIVGCVVSVVWTVACLWVAWVILRDRDFAGTGGVGSRSRGRGWAMPARITVALVAVVALFAVAANWGPAGVTPKRLKASFTPTFTRLTLLQQRQLGRHVPRDAKLNIQTSCSRRAATPNGPGDWACTLLVYIPQLGAVPFQQTPVTYDVSVNSDGCYKATSPPQFVGGQTMRDSRGHMIVNPLFTIYGCFDLL